MKPKLLHHLLASAFPNLQRLDLQACSYEAWQLVWLKQLRGLSSLSLQLSDAVDAVDLLKQLPSLALTSLKLSGCVIQTQFFLFPAKTHIDIDELIDTLQISFHVGAPWRSGFAGACRSSGRLGEALLELRRCTTLRKLELGSYGLSNAAGTLLDALWGLTQLEHLAIAQHRPKYDEGSLVRPPSQSARLRT